MVVAEKEMPYERAAIVNTSPAFKQTEVGLIPSDWEIIALGNLLKYKPTYGINAAAVIYTDNLPAYIRITDISEDGRFQSDKKTSVNHSNADNYFLNEGDIVLARTGASVGKSYLYNSKDGKLVFAGFLIKISPNLDKLIAQYIKAFLETRTYWNWVTVMSMRSGQPGINGNEYARLLIPLPPTITEQCAIATALSDVDALITSLDALIDKKRNIKQGTMQQLLTGKKRLPGFSGEWETKTLGEVLNVRHGKSQHEIAKSDGQYPILATGGEIGRTDTALYSKPSVLIGRKGTIDVPRYMDTPFWTVDTLFYTEINNNSIAKFVFYKFCLIDWYSHNEASGVPSLNASTIEKIRSPFPPTLTEQRAIAQTLSDMDAELDTFTRKRDKYKAVKQGMMQQLLTGKVRLI